ncbi:DNA mismatch repair endonuclease MutL [Flavobacteriaceae bacterium]|jgi:DNA mismatch repair protein MutL|nr:DNA mismatch repair endonuclease MutL [Flavobacteriaceae bacterium]MDA7765128.1 DNA mismatch repair endonuclease MutL [Flavobacteriaceae bacterium]MDA9157418.1 DNA mismatch repair endonuclease MutL [Flavobacteriaceae bacterium]MDA9326788.1 DNA mismatch repair endonuclease MutL [Flavobacteriaceae bacterium]MDB2695344.1 DNA mismatch repair endonuclease MutL [Flavobacteriaceae bacterium]
MTNRISLLPDHVANQIAAGEVIQRPASVVKELLENAVDAGSDTIQLIVKDAGKTLVQVIDNGTGMNSTDIRLAFERHATSKINIAEDLFTLKTKGFRGEALASIAAIAHVETHTRVENEDVSHCLKIEGSQVIEQTLSTQPKGTSIAVKSLFYNIPARRNFLKSDTVELRHVIDEFHRVALAHPEIKFLFFNNGSELFDLPSSNLRKRLVAIFGNKLDSLLVPIEETTSLARLNGFVVKPSHAKKTRGQQFFFVNNRFIRSPFLNHAVSAAFEGLLRPGFNPGYFLFLELDPKTIDINIHPTKTEVKFEDEQSLYAILRSTIKHSLGIFQVIPTLDFEQNQTMEVPYAFKNKVPTSPPIEVDSSFNPFKDSASNRKPKMEQWEGLYSGIQSLPTEEVSSTHSLVEVPQATRVFQLFSKYIVCPLRTSMLLIDQSRAHQRILYERFLSAITTKKGISQQLLFPLTIELNPQQEEQFKSSYEILEALGFEIKHIEKSIEVMGAPEHCPPSKIESVIETLLLENDKESENQHFSYADQVAKSMAQSLAIRPGETLKLEEQHRLLDDFFGCKETTVSPFNKQIFITLEKGEIEQKLS